MRIANTFSVTADYRLSRRGSSQTNQTFLRVDDGEGDYVLVDSVYVPRERGDYILVTEQVGELKRTTEAEKYFRLDLEPGRISNSVLLQESTFRYEVNSRELGAPESDFRTEWLAPMFDYFDINRRFSRIEHQYQWRRKVSSVGLRGELSAKFRSTDNDLDISQPRLQESEEARFLLAKTLGKRDNIEGQVIWRNSFDEQTGVYTIWLRRRGGDATVTLFRGAWECISRSLGFARRLTPFTSNRSPRRSNPGSTTISATSDASNQACSCYRCLRKKTANSSCKWQTISRAVCIGEGECGLM